MTKELKFYLLSYCRDWMLPDEIKALRRISLTNEGELTTRKIALENPKMELLYGFQDIKVNELVELGEKTLEANIAERILRDNRKEVINNCPKCGKLARTPKAKQCRYCQYDWH